MRSLGQYTNTDKVRAAIGVTDDEISDDMLVDQNLEMALLADLSGWISNHATIYATGRAAGATAAESLQADYLELYAMWFCAKRASEMVLAIPQVASDGKSEVRRFAIDGILEKAISVATANMMAVRAKLTEAVTGTAASDIVLFGKASPGYDPVTGT